MLSRWTSKGSFLLPVRPERVEGYSPRHSRPDRESSLAILINDQYRICFIWSDAGAVNVEITDYHS